MKNMKVNVSIILAGIAIILFACSQSPKDRIESLEKKISADNFTLDENGKKVAADLVTAYLEYAGNQKDSPEAANYLYKAADLSLNLGNSRQSLDLYNQIIYQYPEFVKAPECLFLMGYIYENYFQELGKAKEVYELFLSKYPNHDFSDDARVSIENLGKSPEELIRSFEEKNKTLPDTVSI
jgi:TolA-binding protein